MPEIRGAKGSTVFVEPSHDTPLVWLSVIVRTGSAHDPVDQEGFWRHAFELARRGTRSRSREALDEALDRLGASFDSLTARDYSGFSGLCLVDNLDDYIALAAEVLSEPRFGEDEHERLIRESLHYLDEVRDDDSDVAMRFFNRHVAPGYAYARTSLGTEDSLNGLGCAALAKGFSSSVSAGRLIIGLAGDIDETRALEVSARLTANLDAGSPGTDSPIKTPEELPPSRVILVDKPKRTQSQIMLGHLAPTYGSRDYTALLPVEAAFGGMFSSRMMQEIRVKRGWSYGAYCRMSKARSNYWLRMTLAPSQEQTAPALQLIADLYRELADEGVHGDELDFAKRFLSGQTAFQLDTARRRLGAAMEPALLGSPAGFIADLPKNLAALRDDEAWAATQRWIRPDKLCTVIVSTASALRSALEDLDLGPIEVVGYDSY